MEPHPNPSAPLRKHRAQVLAIDLDRRACWGCRPGRGLCHRHKTRFRGVVTAIIMERRDRAGVAA